MAPKKVTPYQMRQGLTYQHETPRFLQSMYKSLGLNPQPHTQNGDSDSDSAPTVALDKPSNEATKHHHKGNPNAPSHSGDEGDDSVLELPLDDQPQVVVVDSTKHLSLEQAQSLAQRTDQSSGSLSKDGLPTKIAFKTKAQRRNPDAIMTTPNDKRKLASEARPSTNATPNVSKPTDQPKKRRRIPKAKNKAVANRNVLSFDDDDL